ncbi:MAG: membrane protein insertion efficiency factor YidD [Victivallaceae bacterium]
MWESIAGVKIPAGAVHMSVADGGAGVRLFEKRISFSGAVKVKNSHKASIHNSTGVEENDSAVQLEGGCRNRNYFSSGGIFLLVLLIKIYQKVISPWLGACCRFTPSCSNYALTALQRHGVFKGLLLTLWRIARCNPYCKGGLDQVPERGKWR